MNALLARTSLTPLVLLVVVTAAAWSALAADVGGDAAAPAAFLLGWLVMMAAMMLPSVTPLVLLYARQHRPAPLVFGYLLVWAAVGVPVYALHAVVDLMAVPGAAVAAVLVGAGVYQLTPLKTACLSRCRSPVSFLVERWGRGPLRLGAEHGAYCVGCCWGLMTVLVVAGAMGFAWAAAVALVVFVEKVLPAGPWVARVAAAALIGLGVAVAADPDLAMKLTGTEM